MRASDFDIPAGQPFRKVRDFLRAEREIFTPKAVVKHFGADISNELKAKGLIEPYVSTTAKRFPLIGFGYRHLASGLPTSD